MALVTHRLDRCAVDSFQRLNRCFWLAAVLMIATASCQRANAETIAATPNVETQALNTFLRFYTSSCSSTYFETAESARACFCSSSALGCVGNYHTNSPWAGGANEAYAQSVNTAFSPPTSSGQYSNFIVYKSGSNYFSSGRVLASTAVSCPSGWTASGANCQRTVYSCPSTGDWTLSGTNCTRDECPGDQTRKPDGNCGCQPWGDQEYTWSHSYPTPLRQWPPPVVRCISSCEFRGQPFSANSDTGQVWFNGGMTGSTCSGPDEPEYDPPAGQDPPSDPPSEPETPTNDEAACLRSGGSPGEVNGQPVCLPGGTPGNPQSPGETTERTTNPDGSTTDRTETPVTTCSTEGCTTTTTIVERVCEPGGSPCTTTTTTRTEPTDDGSDGEDEGDPFCEANPTDPTCKRSAWSGTCGAFTCDGDAVQCAIAQEQHKRNCELLTDSGDLARADSVSAFNSEVAEFDKSTLTTTTPLDSISGQTLYASALSDQTYTIQGQSITIPFSSLVDYLSYAGLAFMIVCGMVSVRIFSTVLG